MILNTTITESNLTLSSKRLIVESDRRSTVLKQVRALAPDAESMNQEGALHENGRTFHMIQEHLTNLPSNANEHHQQP